MIRSCHFLFVQMIKSIKLHIMWELMGCRAKTTFTPYAAIYFEGQCSLRIVFMQVPDASFNQKRSIASSIQWYPSKTLHIYNLSCLENIVLMKIISISKLDRVISFPRNICPLVWIATVAFFLHSNCVTFSMRLWLRH